MHSTARDRSPAQQRSCPHCIKSRISHGKKKRLASSQPAAASCPGWFFHELLLGAVTFRVIDALGISHHSVFLKSKSLQPVSKWFLGWIVQGKCGIFGFLPFSQPCWWERTLHAWKYPVCIQAPSTFHLQSLKTGWFCNSVFWLIAHVLQPCPWGSSHIPAC